MSVETYLCTGVSGTSEVEIEVLESSKVELGGINDFNLSSCEDQGKVGEDCGDIGCDSGENSEGEVKEGSEGSFVMVSDGAGDKNSESVEEDDVFEGKAEEEKREEAVESDDSCNVEGVCSTKHEDDSMEGSVVDIGGNIEGVPTFDDEKIEDTKLETDLEVEVVEADEEKQGEVVDTKVEHEADVVEPKDLYKVESESSSKAEGSLEHLGGNADDDDEKIEDTQIVNDFKVEHVQPGVDHFDNLNSSQENCDGEFENKDEVKLATDPVQPELHQLDNLNSTQQSFVGKIESEEQILEAVIGDNQDSQTIDMEGIETYKLVPADEVVKIEEPDVMVSENFNLAKSGDDVSVEQTSGPLTKEENQEFVENVSQEVVEIQKFKENDTIEETSGSLRKEESQENVSLVNNTELEVEVTDSFYPSGDSIATSLECSELSDEEKKEDGDSSYVFVDGIDVVSHDPVEKGQVIDNATTNSSLEAQKEESQVHPHAVVVGTVVCGQRHTASTMEVSLSSSVDTKLETGTENNSSDKDEYLHINPINDLLTKDEVVNDSSELESDESVTPLGDAYLESEGGTGSPFSIRETTASSCTDTSDGKVDEKIEEAPTFRYLIRVPRYFDDKIEEQIKHALLEVDEKIRMRDAIRVEVEAQKSACDEYRYRFEAAKLEVRTAHDALRMKRQEMDSVQSALNSIKNAYSVEEIGNRIHTMQRRMEHETIPLKEEKQLIREMKQLRLQRQQLCSVLEESKQTVDHREDLEMRLKLLRQDLDSTRNTIRKNEANADAARKRYFDENKKLRDMQEKVRPANDIQQKSYKHLQNLKKHRYDKNNYFRKYKDDAKKAVEYGSSGNTEALQTHCVNQVENFMELWNTNDDFRNDYLRCNTWSTWKRLRTSEVLAIVPPERKVRDTQVSVTAKASDEMNAVPQVKPVLPLVDKKSEKKPEVKQEQKHETTQLKVEVEEKIEVKIEEEKKPSEEEKEAARKKEEEAAIERREQLLLEERVKAKEAEERKKRNAEKAHARAELKAQKEAEQKEKEKAKKERRKARKKAAKEEEPPMHESPESSAPESTITGELVIEEPKSVSKPSVVTNHSKTRIAPLPPPLRKKNKKRTQTWMWVLLLVSVLVVFVGVIFLPNLRSMLK